MPRIFQLTLCAVFFIGSAESVLKSASCNVYQRYNYSKRLNLSTEICDRCDLESECKRANFGDGNPMKIEDGPLTYGSHSILEKYFNLIPRLRIEIDGIGEQCRTDLRRYFDDLKELKLWALEMYDSTAKLPSSLLKGNVNQYGDFDQCIRIEPNNNEIKGKYCLVSSQVTLQNNASHDLRRIYDLTHSFHAFKSELSDVGHRIPRFSSIMWGVCIPNSCTASDLQLLLDDLIGKNVDTTIADVKVLVDPKMCQESRQSISNGTIYATIFFTGVLAIVIFATLTDRGIKSDVLNCFSLRRNLIKLFSTNRSREDIESVHGIRFFNAMMLIHAHKSMALFFYPFVNRTEMVMSFGMSWSVIGRIASLYTDPFIMFSGLLTCYTILGKKPDKHVSIWSEYLNRFTRLIPTLAALIIFCTWILPEIGSGPQWPLVVDHHSDICKKYWWRNFLFIHNYFGFQDMCLTHTHHIGIDTQLFIIGVPLIVWMRLNHRHTNTALKILAVLAIVSTAGRFYISYSLNMANYIYFGASVQQLFTTANHMYILPFYRLTVYIMGIFLAMVLRSETRKLTTRELFVGWIGCVLSLLLIIVKSSKMGRIDYEYNTLDNAVFAALAPIGWCSSFAWIIFTMHHGYSSAIGRLFSWKGFVIWTRLSYAVYLIQFPLFFYNIGITRQPARHHLISDTFNMSDNVMIIILSIVLTVLFELPFQNLKETLLKSRRS